MTEVPASARGYGRVSPLVAVGAGVLLVLGGAVGIAAAEWSGASLPSEAVSSAQLIWDELDRGTISELEAARLFLQSLYRPAGMPPRFRGDPDTEPLCATPQWQLIERQWDELSEGSRRLVPFVADIDPAAPGRDNDYDGDWADSLATEHFLILHTLDETDPMHTTVAYRDLLAECLETAFLFYRDDPDFRLGEAQGTGPPNPAGFPRIRVRVLPLSNASAYARPEDDVDGCRWATSGSIRIRPDLQPDALERATAHEVWHLFCYAINPWQPSWLHESTARWAAAEVWPGTFQEGVTTAEFMRKSYQRLWSDYPFQRTYGGYVFWAFLEEYLGGRATVEVWKRSCEPYWVDALEELLVEEWNREFDEVLAEFWRWNYRNGYRDDGRHNPGADRLPFPWPQRRGDLPESGEIILDPELLAQPAGANFVEFQGAATREHLRIVVDGDPAASDHRVTSVVATTDPSTHTQDQIRFPDESGDCEFVVTDWHLYDSVTLIVTNFRSAFDVADSLGYRILVEEIGAPVFDVKWAVSPIAFREIRLASAPNPFGASTQIRYRAVGNTSVAIHDAQGRLVCELARRASDEAGDYYVTWDGRDARGRQVAAGIYFLNLDAADGSETRKISVLR